MQKTTFRLFGPLLLIIVFCACKKDMINKNSQKISQSRPEIDTSFVIKSIYSEKEDPALQNLMNNYRTSEDFRNELNKAISDVPYERLSNKQ